MKEFKGHRQSHLLEKW